MLDANQTVEDRNEAEYIRLTDLAKLRIVKQILFDVEESSLNSVMQIRVTIGNAIRALEGNLDDE